jgi:hypothetical protein
MSELPAGRIKIAADIGRIASAPGKIEQALRVAHLLEVETGFRLGSAAAGAG